MTISRIPQIVERTATRMPDRVALQDRLGGRRVTYQELWARVRGGAAVLRGRGLDPGARVLLLMDGSPDWTVALLSILEADLVAVPLPGATPIPLVSLAARYTGASACVTDTTEHATVLREHGLSCLASVDLASTIRAGNRVAAADAQGVAVLAFTSGSTTQPRAVALTHANVIANLSALLQVRQAAPDEAMLSILPTAHLYELVAGQLAPLAAGARIVYAGAPMPNRLVDAMRDQAITYALVVPALVDALAREVIERLVGDGAIDSSCRTARPDDLALTLERCSPQRRQSVCDQVRHHIGPSLRTLASGGAAIDPAWTSVLDAVGVTLDVGYGLTEAGPLVAMGSAAGIPRGSVGRRLPGVDVRIDTTGEILVMSASVMAGYAGNPALTAEALAGGWLHTGDRGRLDRDGFLFVDGRIKEAIVTANGDTLYPDEIEPYYASPLFAESCVVPMPDACGNDRATLLVVAAEPGTTDPELTDAFAELRAAAPARYRVHAMQRLHAPLPRTALGKIRRRALAESLGRQRMAS
ncbi:MAG TPA: class I adenylate-forming enzyme family protein [Vicinamibacterales bacterium]|nr:class I adenylate-forming enzyme family protein [Vicinamibacterales bacterium]